MSSVSNRRASLWFLFLASAAVGIGLFFVPAFIIRPFRHQTASALALAMAVRQRAPWGTLIAALICLVFALLLWGGTRWRKFALATVMTLVAFSAVMSRLNYFEWMFHPVPSAQFESAAASKLGKDEMILAVRFGSDARAYPIREMAYHHVLNDVVAGVPVAVTYWTLCHTGLVWTRTVNGKVLHFYLAGINNQNFLMRDKETGTWWQQITGKALYGPLKGASLDLVLSDELTFCEWKSEFADGKVLAEVPKYVKEYDSNWEPEVAKLPVVISFPGTELKSRDIVVGLKIEDTSRAYPWETLVKQSPVVDHVHGTPLLVAVGPGGKSFRVFISRIDGRDAEFFLKGETEGDSKTEAKTETNKDTKPDTSTAAKSAAPADAKAAPAGDSKANISAPATPAPTATAKPWILLDTTTASEWNFQGCAISGPSQGKCLDRIPALKDYWFDWRNYHPDTTIYKR